MLAHPMHCSTLNDDVLGMAPGDIVIYDPADVPGLDTVTAVPHVVTCCDGSCAQLLLTCGQIVFQSSHAMGRSADWSTARYEPTSNALSA